MPGCSQSFQTDDAAPTGVFLTFLLVAYFRFLRLLQLLACANDVDPSGQISLQVPQATYLASQQMATCGNAPSSRLIWKNCQIHKRNLALVMHEAFRFLRCVTIDGVTQNRLQSKSRKVSPADEHEVLTGACRNLQDWKERA